MTVSPHHPYHPIIYVRGFAVTDAEIEEAVADPYMGFNRGSTKARTAWTGEVRRYYFESPLVRLMTDYGYCDGYHDGEDLVLSDSPGDGIPYRIVVIYRYYDQASRDFGTGQAASIEQFAHGLDRLILALRDRVCANPRNRVSPDRFKVYLVAHSMGGLICRAFLQNHRLSSAPARAAVDKVFTYATPHNGIDLRLVRNVPAWLSFGDVSNFNRSRMAEYLDLPPGDDVAIVRHFPPERIFNLIGTNARDYPVAGGLSAWAAGDASDGLVRIDNAATHGPGLDGRDITSPRAFVHRSHSGPYGIVNSEEGYQNLTRFLFGSVRMDGILDIDDISLPREVQRAYDAGQAVRASYQFEVAVSVRGCPWQLTRRTVGEHSAIFRQYDALFPRPAGQDRRVPDRGQSPHLFSLFLDPARSVTASRSVSFAFELKLLVPDYQVDGRWFLKRHYEGGYILHRLILVEARPDPRAPYGWRVRYGRQEDNPGKPGRAAELRPLDDEPGVALEIPIRQRTRPGLRGTLRIEARPWR